MANGYTHIKTAVKIPVPGDKLIEELVGRVATDSGDISIAHMVAPPGWTEPAQTPDFTEFTVMVRGTLQVEIGDDTVELRAGETLRAEPGMRIRYTNKTHEPCEYYAICTPAFSMDLANRDPD